MTSAGNRKSRAVVANDITARARLQRKFAILNTPYVWMIAGLRFSSLE